MEPTTFALIAAIAGPIGAYLVAARRFSGKIESSDAKELWAESRSIRDWSQARIADLNETVERLEKRVGALERSNDELVRENKDLIAQNRSLLETTSELREKVTSLTEQLGQARVRIAELENSK